MSSDKSVLEKWEGLTPLARNERTVAELKEGKRRPCCWMGCIHRSDKPISPSVRWVLDKKSKALNP